MQRGKKPIEQCRAEGGEKERHIGVGSKFIGMKELMLSEGGKTAKQELLRKGENGKFLKTLSERPQSKKTQRAKGKGPKSGADLAWNK